MTLQKNKISELGMWFEDIPLFNIKCNFTFLALVSCQQLSNILEISNLQFYSLR